MKHKFLNFLAIFVFITLFATNTTYAYTLRPSQMTSVSYSTTTTTGTNLPTNIIDRYPPKPVSLSGVYGKALTISPCPEWPKSYQQECFRPYVGSFVVKDKTGSTIISQFSTNETGDFKAALNPGVYLLIPVSSKFMPSTKAYTVKVYREQYTYVELIIK